MKASRKERKSIFDESMEAFYRAAELIQLHPRVRLELEEPDFEHVFYITIVTPATGSCRSRRDGEVPRFQGPLPPRR